MLDLRQEKVYGDGVLIGNWFEDLQKVNKFINANLRSLYLTIIAGEPNTMTITYAWIHAKLAERGKL